MKQFEKITIENIPLVKQRLQTLRDTAEDKCIEIDFEVVQQIDLSGLQLLVSFHQSLEKQNISLKLLNISTDIEAVLHTTGLDTYFTKG